MALPKDIKARIKSAYIENRTPLSVLAALFGVDTSTISRWKQADLKQGDDWDKNQAAALLSGEEMEQTTRKALSVLMQQVQGTLEMLAADTSIDPVLKSQCLASLVDALHKANLASRRWMPSANKLAIARETIKHLAQFVQLHHSDKTGELVAVIESFGSHLPRVFKE